jgi:hypothetical protein
MGLAKSRRFPLSSVYGERRRRGVGDFVSFNPIGRYCTLFLHGSCQRIRMEALASLTFITG